MSLYPYNAPALLPESFLMVGDLVRKFSAFYRILKSITEFTKAHHYTTNFPKPDEPNSYIQNLHFNVSFNTV